MGVTYKNVFTKWQRRNADVKDIRVYLKDVGVHTIVWRERDALAKEWSENSMLILFDETIPYCVRFRPGASVGDMLSTSSKHTA